MDARLRPILRLVLAFGLTALPMAAAAVPVFVVAEPWVRVAPDGRSAEAYMQLRSSEGGAIVGVRSEMTASVALRPPGATPAAVNEIALPAGVAVLLAPGAYRLGLPSLAR